MHWLWRARVLLFATGEAERYQTICRLQKRTFRSIDGQPQKELQLPCRMCRVYKTKRNSDWSKVLEIRCVCVWKREIKIFLRPCIWGRVFVEFSDFQLSFDRIPYILLWLVKNTTGLIGPSPIFQSLWSLKVHITECTPRWIHVQPRSTNLVIQRTSMNYTSNPQRHT